MKKYQLRRKSMLRRDRQKRKRLELIGLHSSLNPIKSLLFCSFFSQNLLDVITGSLICSFLYLLLVLAQNLLFCVRWDVHDLYLGRRQLHGSISRSKSWNQKQSNIRLFKKIIIISFHCRRSLVADLSDGWRKRSITWKKIRYSQ